MLEIDAVVYKNRNYEGALKFHIDGMAYEMSLAAKTDPTLDRIDPPPGVYRFILAEDLTSRDAGIQRMYGPAILYFQGIEGEVMAYANTKHRTFLLGLHGGSESSDGRLLTSGGTLRIRNSQMCLLLRIVELEDEVILTLHEEKLSLLGRLTTPKISHSKMKLNDFTRESFYRMEGDTILYEDPFWWLWLIKGYDLDVHGNLLGTPEQETLEMLSTEVEEDIPDPQMPPRIFEGLPMNTDPPARQEEPEVPRPPSPELPEEESAEEEEVPVIIKDAVASGQNTSSRINTSLPDTFPDVWMGSGSALRAISIYRKDIS